MTYDQAQNVRIKQRTGPENPGIRIFDALDDLPEQSYKGQLVYVRETDLLYVFAPAPSTGHLGYQAIGDFTASTVFVGPTAPGSPDVGDQWLDTSNGQLLTWDGSSWVDAIGPDQVTGVEVADDSISANHITADSIDATRLTANAITSKHTITGAVFRTAATGNRIIMHDDGAGGTIDGYTGTGLEVTPTKINPGVDTGRPILQLRAGSYTATPGGTILLYGDSGTANRKMTVNCDQDVSGDFSANTLTANTPPTDSGTLQHAVWGASGLLKKQTSSRRYKEDIEVLETDVHTLLKLTPKQFKDKVSGAKSVGFIAEEAADLGLERWVVRRTEDRKPEAFGYSEWTAALQKICQAQQKQINELTHRVTTLERMAGGHS